MKTQLQIHNELTEFSNKFGLDIEDVSQGSSDWFMMKLGVISASNAYKVVAKKTTETRNTYLMELVAQVCTGDMDEIGSKYLEWGQVHEGPARSSYEFLTNNKISTIPFVYKDSEYREGCSPDGLIGNSKGLEIKCPYNAVHYVKFLVEDKIKPEYMWQAQYSMRVLGADEWDFVQYHPMMQASPIKILTLKKDAEYQKILNDCIPEFISDMDIVLKKIGIKFGEQWSRIGNKTTKRINND